ncbi:hypothetical protein SDRG_14060 [Saprolegnia diclina VS20]|uniref:Major facilitator superfamily (MFS) profile domain-containing protein n=1 Tax=Saprolegnia diclina (strain VS20) TaxID=1156394 RepID=T0RF07_SAPDV|nr:hypothetical protein SDRG_14060 [Saprolegnia diclina VS20]EQC28237.1 hypothetical protein SDRG_14060 [Saprolegnia diclina VS20]|eukprot:XP_008618386.1 hypothetical protein SDRG_14060 [Saprolegnia diclina VS20]
MSRPRQTRIEMLEPKSDWQVESERYLWCIPSPWYSAEPETYHILFGLRFRRWQLLLAALSIHALLGYLVPLGASEPVVLALAVATGLTTAVSCPLLQQRGPRTGLVLGSACIFLGHFCLLAPSLHLLYGVCIGAGLGLNHFAVSLTLQPWYPRCRATMTSLLLASSVMGGVIAMTSLPRHVLVTPPPDDEVPAWALGVGCTATSLLLLLAVAVRTPPPSFVIDDDSPIVISTLRDAVCSRSFACLGVALVLKAAATAVLSRQLLTTWLESTTTEAVVPALLLLVSLPVLVAFVSDIPCGRSPAWRRHWFVLSLASLQVLLALVAPVSSPWLLVCEVTLDMAFLGLLPAFLWDLFGAATYVSIYSYCLAIISSAIVASLALVPPNDVWSDDGMLLGVTAVALLSLCCVRHDATGRWCGSHTKRQSVMMTAVIDPPYDTVRAFVESQQRASELVLLARESDFSQAILAPRSSTGGSSIYI